MLGAQRTQVVLGMCPVAHPLGGAVGSGVRYLLCTSAFLSWSPTENASVTFLSPLQADT